MTTPNLKRIKISSETDLRTWLARNSDHGSDVMIVTCNSRSRDKFVSSEQVREVVRQHGWVPGRSYTLRGDLVGHVASPE